MSPRTLTRRLRKTINKSLAGFFILGQLIFPFMAVQPAFADTLPPTNNTNEFPYWCLGTYDSSLVFNGGFKHNLPSSITDTLEYTDPTTGIKLTYESNEDDEPGTASVTDSATHTAELVIVNGGGQDDVNENGSFTDLIAPINPQNSKPFGISHVIVCYDEVTTTPDPEAFLTLEKKVIGGIADQDDFTPLVDGGATIQSQNVAWDTKLTLTPGTYGVSEDAPLVDGYTQTDLTCKNRTTRQVVANPVVLADGDNVTCRITNTFEDGRVGGDDDKKADITVKKFHDFNSDGEHDDGEKTLSDWEIRLYDEDRDTPIDSRLTGSGGGVVFDNLSSGTYYICEVMQAGWEQTWPTTGVSSNETGEGEFCHKVILVGGQDFNCLFGNVHKPQLLIEKTNNAGDTLIPPVDVIYTIHVDNPQASATVHNAVVGDVLPAGFSFTGNFQVISDVRGDISATANPSYNANNFGTWQLGTLVPGEEVDIIYEVHIARGVPAGMYENVAFVEACAEDKEICEKPVVGRDKSPEEADDKFAESKVTVGAVLGEVQRPVLAVTGTPMASSLVIGSLVSSLAGLLSLSREQLRRLSRIFGRTKSRIKKVSRSAVLIMVFSILSAVPALAASWELKVADLATVRSESTTLAYSVATFNESDGFEATLNVDGPVDYNRSASFTGNQARQFALDFPQDGNYTLTVSVENATQGGVQSDTQTVLVDVDGDGTASRTTTTAVGGFGGGQAVAQDAGGVVSDVAATDSNQADDGEGRQQAATDDEAEDENGEEEAEDDEEADSNVLPTVLILGAVALAAYYILSRRGVEG